MVLGKSIGQKNWTRGEQATRTTARTSSLRLLILTQFFPPDFAATGQLIEELANQLSRQDVDVNVFTGQPGYAFAKGEAPQVEKTESVWVKRSRITQLLPNKGKALNGLLFALRAIFHLMRRSRQYDVMLVTTAPPFLPVIGYLANLFLGTRYVCLLYDLYPDIAIELDVIDINHPIAKMWRAINRQVWRRSESIIVLSDSMKQRIISHCPEVENKISVIHSWSNEKEILPIAKSENWFAKEHDLVEPFVVLYSGNMGRCHDIDTLLGAARLLKDEPILFVCIGGGAKREALLKDIEAHSLGNFRFLPYQEKEVLPYSLTASDLSLVSVAQGMESLVAPSKLYPAMATGRAIAAVCPSSSYIGALLESAGCGAAFCNGDSQQLADFIRILSEDVGQAQCFGAAGRAYLESHFTPEIIAKKYLKVIKAAIR